MRDSSCWEHLCTVPPQYDAKVKYRITPRLTSEIFLRQGAFQQSIGKATEILPRNPAHTGGSCGLSGILTGSFACGPVCGSPAFLEP